MDSGSCHSSSRYPIRLSHEQADRRADPALAASILFQQSLGLGHSSAAPMFPSLGSLVSAQGQPQSLVLANIAHSLFETR